MIDKVNILIKAGNGGNGSVSFRREKYIPKGGPDGGDGGRGGNIIIKTDGGINTLIQFRYKKNFAARNGNSGQGKNKQGAKGDDLVINVPIGTQVWEYRENEKILIADLDVERSNFTVAVGGRGGRGNTRFATSTNRVPMLAEEGEEGEEKEIDLALKLLADVGIMGVPNAGKSSLLTISTAATPKVANYSFTTFEPVLGVVQSRDKTFVAVDIPGLIEGAHTGRGLGIQFLQHIERTKVLVHLLDGTSENLKSEWEMINKEIRSYDKILSDIPQVIVINKVDMPEVRERITDLRNLFSGLDLLFISAVTGEGVNSLWDKVVQVLDETKNLKIQKPIIEDIAILRPNYKSEHKVYKEGEVFVVASSQAERIAALVDDRNWKAMLQLYRRLERLGIIDSLKIAGVEEGSIVRIGKLEMEWQ